jgi:hypothetical protein
MQWMCTRGRTSRTPFQRGTTKQKEHWNSSIQTCVAQGHHPPLADMHTMYHLLMIILARPGYIFLKSKDEVFSKFKEFKALIENLSERKINILRSDNGGEYTSKEFIRLL